MRKPKKTETSSPVKCEQSWIVLEADWNFQKAAQLPKLLKLALKLISGWWQKLLSSKRNKTQSNCTQFENSWNWPKSVKFLGLCGWIRRFLLLLIASNQLLCMKSHVRMKIWNETSKKFRATLKIRSNDSTELLVGGRCARGNFSRDLFWIPMHFDFIFAFSKFTFFNIQFSVERMWREK